VIEVSTAGVTVSEVMPLTLPELAVMTDEPVASADARPIVEMVATAGLADAHVTEAVTFLVEPSVYVPVAMNCSVRPLATDGSAGVTAIEVKSAAVTVRVVVPVTPPSVALTVLPPSASAMARPVLVILATATLDDAQAADAVRFCVVPSEYVPVATNCSVNPLATLGLTGVSAIDVTTAGVTVNVVVPLIEPSVAAMVVEPVVSVDARPLAEIVATATADDVHDTAALMF
jgi:hypothetical protein